MCIGDGARGMWQADRIPDIPSVPFVLNADEARLVRFFRCMTDSEQEGVLIGALESLAERCSIDPPSDPMHDFDLNEEKLDDLGGRIMGACQLSAPGMQYVNLDNMGDAGWFLVEQMGDPIPQIAGTSTSDEDDAQELAFHYVHKLRDYAVPNMVDEDGATEEEELQTAKRDFVLLIRHWREEIVKAIERQSGPRPNTRGQFQAGPAEGA
jgi:hypothetical protein